VSFADRLDETPRGRRVPTTTFEAWDAEPVASFYSLAQPTITRSSTRDPRRTTCSSGSAGRPTSIVLREFWRATLYPQQDRDAKFDDFGITACTTGVRDAAAHGPAWPFVGDSNAAARHPARSRPNDGRCAGRPYGCTSTSGGLRDGTHASNPWLGIADPVRRSRGGTTPPSRRRSPIASCHGATSSHWGRWRVELPSAQPGVPERFRGGRIRPDGREQSARVGVNAAGTIGGFLRRCVEPACARTHRPIEPSPRPDHHDGGRAIVKATTTSISYPAIAARSGRAGRLGRASARAPWGGDDLNVHRLLGGVTLPGGKTCRSSGKTKCGRARDALIRVDRYYEIRGPPGHGRATDDVPALRQRAVRAGVPRAATVHGSDGLLLDLQPLRRALRENNCP
jgi:hypothetical protein